MLSSRTLPHVLVVLLLTLAVGGFAVVLMLLVTKMRG